MISGKITNPENLMGHMKKSSPQITGEINNSNPILAGIGQAQGGSRHAVTYIEQELTDEERAQARRNIAKYQWDWREVSAGNLIYTVADFSKWYGLDKVFDIDAALALTSLASANYSSLGLIVHHANHLVNYFGDDDSYVPAFMDRLIAEYERLQAEGILTGVLRLVFCNEKKENNIDWAFVFYIIDGIAYLDIPSDTGSRFNGGITYNISDKTFERYIYLSNTVINKLGYIGYAADSKAVSDALATRVSFTEVQELTDEQEEIARTNIGIEFATDDEIIELLMILDMFPVVIDFDGGILADENSNILLW